jgi:hypothetical protein
MRLVLKARLLHPFQQALLLLFSALLQHPRPRCQLMMPQLLPPPPCQLMCRWQQALLLELVPATKMLCRPQNLLSMEPRQVCTVKPVRLSRNNNTKENVTLVG